MPSNLEQAAAVFKGMTVLELDCIKGMADHYIKAAKAMATETTDCRFLDLPAELRNYIYYFAAIMHLREYGNTQRCGLLDVNKQIRIEFMDILYSGEVATLCSGVVYPEEADKRRLRVIMEDIATRKSLKALLDGLRGTAKITGTQFVHENEMLKQAKGEIRKMKYRPGDPPTSVLGCLVLKGDPDAPRCVLISCWLHEAKQRGLAYEILEGYPAHVLPGYVRDQDAV